MWSFFDCYHPHCPILLERRQPGATYINDRLLFCSIVSVASQGLFLDPEYGGSILTKEQYAGVVDAVKHMAGDLSICPSREVSTVQGLVFLAHWSFPSFRNKDDRAFHYINLVSHLSPTKYFKTIGLVLTMLCSRQSSLTCRWDSIGPFIHSSTAHILAAKRLPRLPQGGSEPWLGLHATQPSNFED